MAAAAKTIVNDEFLDDDSILNAVNSTHTPDGRIIAIKPLLSVTAKILKDTGITTLDQELLEDNITHPEIVKTIEALTPIIHTVSCKLACELSRGDQHVGTMKIFNSVGHYDWDAKVMIVLTAFAMRYGELCLMATANTSLAATLTVFERLPRTTKNIKVLIEAVTKLSKQISYDNFSLVKYKFDFPIAAYWIIRSLVACSSHFTFSPDDHFTVDISFLIGRINDLYNRIKAKLEDVKEEIASNLKALCVGKTIANLDDNSILNAVNSTHTPDGRITAIKPLLSVTAKILKDTGITTLDQELLKDNLTREEIAKPIEALTPIIHTVSCKLACELSGGDQHIGAMKMFNSVGLYDWDAKVMIVLTAFAIRYGELCLMATANTSLAATLTVFERQPRITKNIQVLIEAVTKLSKCIADVTCFSDQISYDNFSLVEYSKFDFPIAAYWIIRSLVACSSHFNFLPDGQNNSSVTVDISVLIGGINNLYNRINAKLEDLKKEIEKIKYLRINILFEIQQKTNLQILEGIHDSKDTKPLIHCTSRRVVTLEEGLKEKTVMLYVSDLSITAKTKELSMLKMRYTDLCSVNKIQSHQRYEIVWLPIIDKFTEVAETFDDLVADMPWYVFHPLCLKREAKQYIKDKWMYEKKTSLVVLHKGKVVCHDALHLVRVWKKLDFSFTGEEADSLWSNVTWKLDLFEDHFDAPTKDWVRKNNYICLCGGKDIKWIKEFTTELRRVSELTKTQLKVVYIGKHAKEVTNQAKVAKYKMDCWDEAEICSFWEHLESMWHCKMQHHGKTRVTDNNDLIMQELMRMISFGNSEKGWAIFSKGASSNIVMADEEELLTCLREWSFNALPWSRSELIEAPSMDSNFYAREWSLDAITSEEEFLANLAKRLSIKMPSVNHHCISFVLPRDAANFKELLCAQCKQPMEKFLLIRCCK